VGDRAGGPHLPAGGRAVVRRLSSRLSPTRTVCGGGRTPAHALYDLARRLNAEDGSLLGAPYPRAGEEMSIRVIEVAPPAEPRWVAECRWEPRPPGGG
jgi:hypothetical protein